MTVTDYGWSVKDNDWVKVRQLFQLIGSSLALGPNAQPSFNQVTLGGTLILASGSITDTGGTINFDDENLSGSGDLAFPTINDNTAQHLILWETLAVDNAADGQRLRIYRNAPEGKDWIRFYVDQFRQGFIETSYNLKCLANRDMWFACGRDVRFTSALNRHISFEAGGNFLFKDRDASDTVRATIASATGWLALGTANAPTVALDVTGSVKSSQGRIAGTTRVTGATTLNATHHIIIGDTDGGAFTITLPTGVDGTNYKISNVGSSSNALTLVPDGTELLVGDNANFDILDGETLDLHYETTEGWVG